MNDLETMMAGVADSAEHVGQELEADGDWAMMLFAERDDEKEMVIAALAVPRDQLAAAMRKVVAKAHAKRVVLLASTWVTRTPPGIVPMVSPSKDPNHGEELVMFGCEAGQDVVVWSSPIVRDPKPRLLGWDKSARQAVGAMADAVRASFEGDDLETSGIRIIPLREEQGPLC